MSQKKSDYALNDSNGRYPLIAAGGECVALRLFEHNERAYQAAIEMMEQYGKAAIIHPTGTGKSYIAFKLIEEHPNAVIFCLSPRECIFKTQTGTQLVKIAAQESSLLYKRNKNV